MIFQVLGIVFWLGAMPYLLGQLFVNKEKSTTESQFRRYLFGLIIMFALFEVITVPLTFMKCSLTVVSILFVLSCFIFLIFGILKNKVQIRSLFGNVYLHKGSFFGYSAWIIILFQIFFVVTHTHIDDDDAWYVGTAVTSYITDTLNIISPYTGDLLAMLPSDYTLSPFPIFYAMLARLINIHPTILMHTVAPFFWIGASYMVYYLIACILFKSGRDRECFMFILSIFNIFANFSVRSVSTFMLFRIWQGKATLCSLIVPLVYYVFMLCIEEKSGAKNWILLFMLVLAGCMVSSMGVFLVSVLLVILATIFSVLGRKVKIAINTLFCIIPCVIQLGIYVFILR